MTDQTPEAPIHETTDDARQAERQKGMPTVLSVSLVAAGVFLLIGMIAYVSN
ncbi:MAG: hypothetical protein AAFY37_03970 [Pseudomonadota bacterium]